MALATYTDLQASVSNWLHRSDLGPLMDDFTRLTEDRLARSLRIRKMLVSGVINTVPGDPEAPLPNDWLEFKTLSVPDGDALEYVSTPMLDAQNRTDGPARTFTIEGDNILISPTQQSGETLNAVYYARFPSIITANTNWLLENHSAVYLYGVLAQAAIWADDEAQTMRWNGLFIDAVSTLQASDRKADISGAPLRLRMRGH